MKLLLPALALVLLTLPLFATTLRVNNSLNSTAPYKDLITAHGAAQDGDTLLVEGSNINYGTLTVTKRLVILGPGYFLMENPGTPASLRASTGRIYFDRDDSGDPGTGSAGSEVRGLHITNNSIGVEVNDVTIAQNYIWQYVWVNAADISGIQVTQNYFPNQGLWTGNPTMNDFVFSNNIVIGSLDLATNSSGGVFHNLVGGGVFAASFDGEIRGNIFTSVDANAFDVSTVGTGNTSHNTATSGYFGNNDNNNVATADDLFVGETGNSTDGQYRLADNATAAKNNAHDGTDRGPFGGDLPYVLSGLPDLPVILYLQVPGAARPTAPFTATVRASSGN